MAWAWDTEALEYVNTETGETMTRKELLALSRKSLQLAMETATVLLPRQRDVEPCPMTLEDIGAFEIQLRDQIRSAYIEQYILGIGGEDQMTPEDWGSVGGMIGEQYGHLAGFIEDIGSGSLSCAQIEARAQMYISSATEAYEAAVARNAERKGMTEEVWLLADAEHCEDCLAFAAQGYQPIGTFPVPGAGDTACLTNCACHKEFRNPTTGEIY